MNQDDSPRPQPPPSDFPWLPREHFENQRKFPPEELEKYRGRYIAYSWDGRTIVADGDSDEDVRAKLIAAGRDPQRVVYAYVEDL